MRKKKLTLLPLVTCLIELSVKPIVPTKNEYLSHQSSDSFKPNQVASKDSWVFQVFLKRLQLCGFKA